MVNSKSDRVIYNLTYLEDQIYSDGRNTVIVKAIVCVLFHSFIHQFFIGLYTFIGKSNSITIAVASAVIVTIIIIIVVMLAAI